MPVMDGLEATRSIRRPALRDAADHRHDRERHGGGSRALPRRRHERPYRQADRPRPAVRRLAALDPSPREAVKFAPAQETSAHRSGSLYEEPELAIEGIARAAT